MRTGVFGIWSNFALEKNENKNVIVVFTKFSCKIILKRKYIGTSSWSSGCSVSCFWVFNSSTDFNKSLWVYSKARDCRISPWPQAKIVRKNVKNQYGIYIFIILFWLFLPSSLIRIKCVWSSTESSKIWESVLERLRARSSTLKISFWNSSNRLYNPRSSRR